MVSKVVSSKFKCNCEASTMDSTNPKSAAPKFEELHAKFTNSKAKEKRPNSAQSEITIREFLDFLKTAYQVNDSVEGLLLADGMTEAVDWIRLKETELVKPREIACQTSDPKLKVSDDKKEPRRKSSETAAAGGDPGENVKRKLSEVLSEGLLDSVLTYLVPSNTTSAQSSRRPSQQKITEKASHHSNASNAERSLARRKSTDSSATTIKSTGPRADSEVIIHVCDEVKNTKKDFMCNQKLLVEKMGYFAEVTAGQRLEDMDISVHCDIGIFEWLMRWVKKEQLPEEEAPELDPQCVIPVLVSAAFLQMEPLLQDCLLFCHRHMNDVLRTSTNLSCLNDAVMTRLAAMYTNTEVEAIRDRKDKIQSRLYCKLIQSLCEPEPESMRGHWSSLARVFRCGRCQQLVSPSVGPEIPCVPACMRLLCDGSVTYLHVRDPAWNINEYVERLHKSLKTWRKVYWRLWGDAHFLYCTVCKRFFPVHQIAWCRYHPDSPQFFTVDAQRAPLPVGRFPCCGERAYRFQLLENESGCQFREHTPCTDSVRDAAVYSMLENFRNLIEEEPPKLMFPERLTRLVARGGDGNGCEGTSEGNNHFWWEGLELIPPRPKLGLLGAFGDASTITPPYNEPAPPQEASVDDDEYTDCSDSSSSSSDSSSSAQKSEESYHAPVPKRKDSPRTRAARKREGRLWQHNLSARSNQDMQRAYEESALKQIATILGRRTLLSTEAAPRYPTKSWPRHITPPGGLWVRLESEWRERHSFPQQQKMRSVYTGKTRLRTARFN